MMGVLALVMVAVRGYLGPAERGLVFLGFNVAWLLLFDGRSPAPVTPSGTMG
jgi:hypothetical protein